jgi:hypothetical protein
MVKVHYTIDYTTSYKLHYRLSANALAFRTKAVAACDAYDLHHTLREKVIPSLDFVILYKNPIYDVVAAFLVRATSTLHILGPAMEHPAWPRATEGCSNRPRPW